MASNHIFISKYESLDVSRCTNDKMMERQIYKRYYSSIQIIYC